MVAYWTLAGNEETMDRLTDIRTKRSLSGTLKEGELRRLFIIT
jgi:hypothetical protein